MTNRKRRLCAELDGITRQTGKEMDLMRDMFAAMLKGLDEPESVAKIHAAIAGTEAAVRELVTVQFCAVYSEEDLSQIIAFHQSSIGARMRESEPVLAVTIGEGLKVIIGTAIDRVLETI